MLEQQHRIESMGRRKGLTFYQKKKKLNMVLIKEIASWIFWIFVSAFLAVVLVYCVGMKTSVIGSSMEPCLYNGQEIFSSATGYKWEVVGDIGTVDENGVLIHEFLHTSVGSKVVFGLTSTSAAVDECTLTIVKAADIEKYGETGPEDE